MQRIKPILFCLMLLLACIFSGQGQPKDVETGTFLDTLKLPGNNLRLAITLSKGSDGNFMATFNSIDQGSGEIAFDEVSVSGRNLLLKSKAGIEIEGTFDADYSKIAGEFRQGQARFQLEFLRVEQLPRYRRPQEPQKPYPYDLEEVTYMNEAAGIQLAGTLTIPAGEGPFPAVVLLTGSGPQDRDETVFEHKPFKVIADFLTRNGIVVLRSDDRGVGASGGEFNGSTTADFAGDGLAGVQFLMNRPEVIPERTGLIGHSEGGMMAPLAATQSKDIAFIVLMAGPGVNLGDNVAYQGRYVMEKNGASPEFLDAQEQFQLALNDLVRSNRSDEEVISEAFETYTRINETANQVLSLNEQQVKAAAESLLSNWWRYGLRYNPEKTLEAVTCPVLALLGEHDRQVPAALNKEALERAVLNRHPASKVVVVQGVNHLFQTSETGDFSEYIKIEETISPKVLHLILSWINDL